MFAERGPRGEDRRGRAGHGEHEPGGGCHAAGDMLVGAACGGVRPDIR
jgi:hypothetical protein